MKLFWVYENQEFRLAKLRAVNGSKETDFLKFAAWFKLYTCAETTSMAHPVVDDDELGASPFCLCGLWLTMNNPHAGRDAIWDYCSCLNTDMCKTESSQKDEGRAQSADSSKAYRKPKLIVVDTESEPRIAQFFWNVWKVLKPDMKLCLLS